MFILQRAGDLSGLAPTQAVNKRTTMTSAESIRLLGTTAV
jgi:hypothetical protein